ncbi:hypothetical protein HZC00_01865 [Candidatus Kaiserbacteria bacterium]|nr:hypothetical protein [Candidatus Kaiserbacteria bacterium]
MRSRWVLWQTRPVFGRVAGGRTSERKKPKEKKEPSSFDLGGRHTEYTDVEAERYKDPRDFYDEVERQLEKYNDKTEAWRLIENFLPLHIERQRDRGPARARLHDLIIKQENKEEALKFLKEKLGLSDSTEEADAETGQKENEDEAAE